jgi:PiT family inorganic phosphate transporter
MGAGAAKRVSAVRWGVAGNMVGAWILTLPAAGAMGGITYGITRIFGANNAAGPIVVLVILGAVLAFALARRFRPQPVVAAGADA